MRRAFEPLGLRFNPFCVLEPEDLLSTLNDPGIADRGRKWILGAVPVLEFVGDRGSGKSTNMHVVGAVARECGADSAWSYVAPGRRATKWPRPLPRIWLIDEADRLSAARRGAILRAAARGRVRVVLGTHNSVVGECARIGVPCESVALPLADEATIERFLAVRVDFARRREVETQRSWRLCPAASAELRLASGGSLREVEAILYEVFQGFVNGRGPATTIDADSIRAAAEVVRRETTIEAPELRG